MSLGLDYIARWSTDSAFVDARNTIRDLVSSLLHVLGAALIRVDELVGPDVATALADDEELTALRATIDTHDDGRAERGFAEIERLIGEAERIDAPAAREMARDVTARTIALIHDGLTRVNALVGVELARSLAEDELIGMLHVLADTHPDAPEVRARLALEAAAVELGSLGVRLVDVIASGASSDGAARRDTGEIKPPASHAVRRDTDIGEIKPPGTATSSDDVHGSATSSDVDVGATPNGAATRDTDIGEIKPTGTASPDGTHRGASSNDTHDGATSNGTATRDTTIGEIKPPASHAVGHDTDIGETKPTGVTVRLAAERGAKIDDARVRGLVEMIVMTRAPDLDGLRVEIEGLVVADPEFVPLGRLRPSQAHERCSLCASPIGAKHDHLYAPAKREVVCACEGCAHIIPSSEYAAYRRVPRDVRRVPVADITGWLDRLNVPVGVAALIRDDRGGARLAYPGPAGLVEANVDPETWAALRDAVPEAAQIAPEVEALVWSGLTREVLRAGIDVVFRLVGELRKHWRGITGGDGPAALSRVLAEIVESAE